MGINTPIQLFCYYKRSKYLRLDIIQDKLVESISKYKSNLVYGASPEIMRIARELRKNMTKAENILWYE